MIRFDTATLSNKEAYKLLTSAVVPRPIAWVSTLSPTGGRNLAPFSYFNVMSAAPPTLMFSVGHTGSERGFKDTYDNLSESRECVVNIVDESVAEAMNNSATNYPPEVDEFDMAGLTALESIHIAPFRVAESPVHFECKLNQILTLENEYGRSDVMVCDILAIHVAESVYMGDHKIDPMKLKVIGRMAGSDYIRSHDLFQLVRKRHETS